MQITFLWSSFFHLLLISFSEILDSIGFGFWSSSKHVENKVLFIYFIRLANFLCRLPAFSRQNAVKALFERSHLFVSSIPSNQIRGFCAWLPPCNEERGAERTQSHQKNFAQWCRWGNALSQTILKLSAHVPGDCVNRCPSLCVEVKVHQFLSSPLKNKQASGVGLFSSFRQLVSFVNNVFLFLFFCSNTSPPQKNNKKTNNNKKHK